MSDTRTPVDVQTMRNSGYGARYCGMCRQLHYPRRIKQGTECCGNELVFPFGIDEPRHAPGQRPSVSERFFYEFPRGLLCPDCGQYTHGMAEKCTWKFEIINEVNTASTTVNFKYEFKGKEVSDGTDQPRHPAKGREIPGAA